MSTTTVVESTSIRLHYLDWLRVIVVLMLIPFHTTMTYAAPLPWFLRNNELSTAAEGLILVLEQYHMELLFLIAGAATFFSLGVRSGEQYVIERLKRLIVPLIFGMLVLVPPCYWVAAMHYYGYEGSFFAWYPYFLQQSLTPFQDDFSPGVLWFLWYLVLYTAALFPLFWLIRRKFGASLFPRLGRFFATPGMLLLFVIPTALVEIYPSWVITMHFQVFYYAIFFFAGYFLFSHKGFLKGIDRIGPFAIVGAIATMTLLMLLIFPEWYKSILGPDFWFKYRGEPGTAGYIMYRILISFVTWFCLIAILYLAKRFLNFSNRFLRYANDVVLPYYIIHSTAIALIGLPIIQWDMDVLPKYVINTILAFLATAAIYELIRRTNVTRFLFGMRLRLPLRVQATEHF